jgi:MFS family permease
MLVAVAALSQLHRNSLGVMAPDLTRDLSMSPSLFGTVGSMFFIAMAISQIPVGLFFDRIGPRLTVSCCAVLATIGVTAQALAHNGEQFAVARFLLGIGSSANLMGAVALCAVWYPPDRFSTRLSWIYALGQTGTFLATTPLAVVSSAVGWRWAFATMAVVTAGIGALFWICVRNSPSDDPASKSSSTGFREMLSGLVQVYRTPGLLPVLAINSFATGSMATVLGLWASPYLADVHGLDSTTRGNVLLAMAIAQLLGTLAFGPLDRIFYTRKWVVVFGAIGTILTLVGLACISRPPLWLAIGLLVLLCFITAYGVVIMAHGRSLFPADAVGRGITLINIFPVFGLAGLPIVTGAIIQSFPAQGAARPEIAYQYSFGVIALALTAGLLYYLKADDVKPEQSVR